MFLLALIGIPICYYHAFSQQGILNKSPHCGVSNAVWPAFWPYLRSIRLTGTFFGIILYIPVTVNLVSVI